MIAKLTFFLIIFVIFSSVNSQQICVRQECKNELTKCDSNCLKQLNKCSLDCTFGSQGCIQDCVSTNVNAVALLTCAFDKCINL